ncbi:Gfo/Idh/MocA family protein [Thalassotalea profundi]|uniref:Oxidoreductase n=1 Tax=Thalassotalea profundi TaxID=2036687 RepID=A0ABQ3IGN0_9GAMM|nr:Gfo/Idh/MocA family oxidoreductase [Thalassotalea profundi]GHE79142.1 oxidoreductase [Thalassotalea profundi]
MNRLRIAMIGLGDIAQKAYLPIIATHPSITPILCTRNQEVLAQLAKQYRINDCYDDSNRLFESKPDAVMIHSATESHFDIAVQSLNAGIATFIDKPLSYKISECNQLITLARENNIPLYLGFNRRFAPQVTNLLAKNISHIRWQKNRVALPDNATTVIFDDFIHVIDGLCYLAGSDISMLSNLQVFGQSSNEQLTNIRISFECGQRLFEGSMNRASGINEEVIEAFAHNEKYQISGLTTGNYYQEGRVSTIGFSDWDSYLYTRGFVDMIDHWLSVIHQGYSSNQQLAQIERTHQLCQNILEQL